MSLLDELCDAGVDFAVVSRSHGGFDVVIGNDLDDALELRNFNRWDEAERWLADAAVRHFPDSAFAKKRAMQP